MYIYYIIYKQNEHSGQQGLNESQSLLSVWKSLACVAGEERSNYYIFFIDIITYWASTMITKRRVRALPREVKCLELYTCEY